MTDSNAFFPAKRQSWPIGFLAVNIIIYAVVMCAVPGDASGLVTSLKAYWASLLILYLGMVVSLAAGNLGNGKLKAVLVFWGWSQTLPIAQVFARYLPKTNGMALAAQNCSFHQLPSDPAEQEALWLQIHGKYKNNPAVIDVRNDYLVAQEFTWLSFIVLVFFGAASLVVGKSTLTTLAYPAFLLIQYITASIAARSLGFRFFGNVLAVGQVHKIR